MSRAKSPRAVTRSLKFDVDKIKSFGRACRQARTYFNGGNPKEGVDYENDPDYQVNWNLTMADVQYHTGVPISSVSEVETKATYTIGLDTAASLTAFYYANSKNGYLLEPWIYIVCYAEAFLNPDEDLVKKNELAKYETAISVIERLKKRGSPKESTYINSSPPASIEDLLKSVDYLRMELEKLKNWYQSDNK